LIKKEFEMDSVKNKLTIREATAAKRRKKLSCPARNSSRGARCNPTGAARRRNDYWAENFFTRSAEPSFCLSKFSSRLDGMIVVLGEYDNTTFRFAILPIIAYFYDEFKENLI